MNPFDRWNTQDDTVDINEWLAAQRALQSRPAASTPAKKEDKKKKKSFLVDQISTAGGILGGIGGGVLGALAGGAPAIPGAIAGSAGGSALGETLENFLTGEALGNNVLKEGVLGGLFAAPPIKAGKALLGLRGAKATGEAAGEAATAATGQAAKASTGSKMTDLGNEMLKLQYDTVPSRTARATNPGKTIGQLADYGITRKEDVARIADEITGTGGLLSKAVADSVAKSGRVDVSNLRRTLDEQLELAGVIRKDAEEIRTMFDAQMKRLYGGPQGSLRPDAHPTDVLDVMRDFESTIAQKLGRGDNYRLATDTTKRQAEALQLVRDELDERLTRGVNVQDVLTPELRQQLLDLSPGNAQWQRFVDDQVMKSADMGTLRSVQAPFVNARKFIDAGEDNAMTAGGRGGNAAAGVGAITDPIIGLLTGVAAKAAQAPLARGTADLLRRAGGSQAGNVMPSPGGFGTGARLGLAARVGAGGTASSTLNQMSQGGEQPGTLEDALMTSYSAPTDAMQPQTAPVEQSPYSRENLMYDIQRDPANASRYMEYYQQLQDVYAPSQEQTELNASQQKQLMGSQQADNIVNQLENTLSGIGASGRIGGSFARGMGKLGMNDEVSAYEDSRPSIALMLVKAIQGSAGSLSDADREAIMTAIPSVQDTPGERAAKLATLRGMINNARQGAIDTPASLEDALLMQQSAY